MKKIGKPLTVEQLIALPDNEPVYLAEHFDKRVDRLYVKKVGGAGQNEEEFVYNYDDSEDAGSFLYSDYGKTWLAYKKKEDAQPIVEPEVTLEGIEAILKSECFVNLNDEGVDQEALRGYRIEDRENDIKITIKSPFYAGVAAGMLTKLKYIIVVPNYSELYVNKAKEGQRMSELTLEPVKDSEVDEKELIGAIVISSDTQRAGYQPQIILQRGSQYFSVCTTEHGKVQITKMRKTDFTKVRVIMKGVGLKGPIDSSFLLSAEQWKEFGEKYYEFTKQNLLGVSPETAPYGVFGLWLEDYRMKAPYTYAPHGDERKEMMEQLGWEWPRNSREWAHTIESIEVIFS